MTVGVITMKHVGQDRPDLPPDGRHTDPAEDTYAL